MWQLWQKRCALNQKALGILLIINNLVEELAILELVRLPKLLFCFVMNDFICLQTWYFDYTKTPKYQDTRLRVIILPLAFASAVHHVWLQRNAGDSCWTNNKGDC